MRESETACFEIEIREKSLPRAAAQRALDYARKTRMRLHEAIVQLDLQSALEGSTFARVDQHTSKVMFIASARMRQR